MKVPVKPEVAPWYKFQTLFDTFDNLPEIQRRDINVLRIPLYDKFKDKGAIMAYGKIGSGVIK